MNRRNDDLERVFLPPVSYFSPSFDHLYPHAAVSSIDPLATQAALDILRRGGSAVDAAIAANAVLAVTAPDQCGLGGDLVALVYCPPSARGPAQVQSLQAIGHAGTGASAEALRSDGHSSIPRSSTHAITVPGAVDGWLALHHRFGRLRLDQALEAAVGYATTGFPASQRLRQHFDEIRGLPSAIELGDALGPSPTATGLVRRPGTARTLLAIAKLGREGFYAGEFGAELLKMGEGVFRPDDLATPIARFGEPLQANVFGHLLTTNPAPSAGFLILGALARLSPEPTDVNNPSWYHELIEAFRATAWMRRYHHDSIDLSTLLHGQISEGTPQTYTCAQGPDTTAISAVDANGLGIVIVQSNGHAFGTRRATPDTNIFLHDRGAVGFNLIAGDANELAPRKRPRHTLAPVMAQSPDGGLALLAGTMGGDRQPSILAQIITAALRDHMDPRDALVQPRFAFVGGQTGDLAGFGTFDGADEPGLSVEGHLTSSVYQALVSDYGPIATTAPFGSDAGVAHLTLRGRTSWIIAADPRSEASGIGGY